VVDRVVLFVAPVLLGGDGVAGIGPLGVTRVARALRLEAMAVARVGEDVVVEGRVRYPRR
jgi:diaminohydroxyphosphoribosylaminopyrimidine deaminase/5-amino-6-(5-phosphoribosylamino)uracil reductase